MKVGDLVEFHTKAWVFEHAHARYENPGVILERHTENWYTVMWADCKLTTEHGGYLIKEKNNERDG